MTLEAPSRHPGAPSPARAFLLPTLVDGGPPRPFELLDGRAPLALPRLIDGPPLALTAAPAAEPTPAVHATPSVSTDTDAIAELEATLAEPAAPDTDVPAPADPVPSASWAAGVAAGRSVTSVPDAETPTPAVAAAPNEEYRKFSLIDPDRRWVMVAAICLLAGILIASLVSSFTSVYAMASWVGLPPAVQWLPVIILDVAIVGFSWALMVFARRGDRTWSTRLLIAAVTAFSVAANYMHTYDHWKGDLSSPQALMGVTFSSSIPIMALFATEELIRLVFRRIDSHRKGN